MPEIKHNFMKGKMNKDLDERLVPNGEYRDALNVQVSTSEGADVGTVQNILGNSLISGQEFLGANPTCVGSVADEKSDKLYYFVANKPLQYDTYGYASGTAPFPPNQWTHSNGVATYSGATYEWIDIPLAGLIIPGRTYAISFTNTTVAGNPLFLRLGGQDSVFVETEGRQTVYITALLTSSSTSNSVRFYAGKVGGIRWNGTVRDVEIIEVGGSIIEYDSNTKSITPVLIDHTGDVLSFNYKKTITGINVIDDLLLWTDNTSEPKKINISRSKEGTAVSGLVHTNLIVEGVDEGLIKEEHITVIKKAPSRSPGFNVATMRNEVNGNLKQPFGGASNFFRPVVGNPPLPAAVIDGDEMWVAMDNIGGVQFGAIGTQPNIKIGDVLRIYEGYGAPDLNSDPPQEPIARMLIKEIAPLGVALQLAQLQNNFATAFPQNLISYTHQTAIRVSVSTLVAHPLETKYFYQLEQDQEGLFERKLPRFAYRYKYEDNEYSAVGPFSEVVFIPREFSYHPTKAYNEGMINNLKTLTLKGFVPPDIPDDVVGVDLLYKNEFSPSIYVIKSIARDSDIWVNDEYDISTENVYAQLPSDQLIRPWDNVPKTALAQEITGNRVVYGNYTQGYDLSTLSGDGIDMLITPNIEATLDERLTPQVLNIASKSLKSQRTYNFGIVYGDKYGRETPVFTNKSAYQLITKSSSATANAIVTEINSGHPDWADYYKVFVKETANEYYNLAMGRAYDAKDGNVWISFPSVDRNKVDEDTYLILKKGAGAPNIEDIDGDGAGNKAVLDEARYKIVAIDNEAPDYIKTEYTVLAETNKPMTGTSLFGGSYNPPGGTPPDLLIALPAEAPFPGATGFTLSKKWWVRKGVASWELGMPDLMDLWETNKEDYGVYVSFSNKRKLDGVSIVDCAVEMSRKYRITNIELLVGTSTASALGIPPDLPDAQTGYNGHDLYSIQLAEIIPESEAWLTDNLEGNHYEFGGALHPHFYKKKVLNKPEFDGRFFVKIIEDDILTRAIRVDEQPAEGGYKKTITIPHLYHLKDGVSTGQGGTGNLDGSMTHDHWVSNLGGATSTGSSSRWFIDSAAFAGVQPFSSSHPKDSVPTQDGVDCCDTNGYTNYAKFNQGQLIPSPMPYGAGGDGYWAPYLEMISRPWGTGGSNGTQKLKGAHLADYDLTSLGDPALSGHSVGTDRYLHLSYCGINPRPNTATIASQPSSDNFLAQWYRGYYWNAHNGEKNWNVGNDGGPNGATNSQTDIVSNLSVGKLFRLDGDAVVYKILGVTKRRLYNFMGNMHWDTPGVLDEIAGSQWANNGYLSDMHHLGGYQTNIASYTIPPTWKDASSSGSVPAHIVNDMNPVLLPLAVETANALFLPLGDPFLHSTDRSKQHENMTLPENCRLNYLVNYEVVDDPGTQALGATFVPTKINEPGSIFTEMTATTSRRLEFVEEFSTVKNNILTKYPAIFETEPKEDVGLDIYYEASGKKPTRLSTINIHNLVQIGAFISAGVNHTQDDTTHGAFATGIAQIVTEPNLWKINISTTVEQDNFGLQGSEVRFWNDDGSCAVATFFSSQSSDNGVFSTDANGATVYNPVPADLQTNAVTGGVASIIVEFLPNKIGLGWFNCWSFGNGVESNRIGDTFNKPYITNGVKASTTLLEDYKEERRKYGLIYSGIYNSTSGVNDLNQFIAAEKITKDINPIYGSIQKLHSRSSADGDLITLCEDRILKILANKDALYNADGNPQLLANNNVLGQAIPFSGDFGISKNPESFASESYRIYFTDKVRGAVMRLSRDGLTPISDHGMKDWFRDNLKLTTKLVGSYDDRGSEYNITLADRNTRKELTTNSRFDDSFNGWNLGSGWTYGGGKIMGVAVGQYQIISQDNLPITAGKDYVVTYTISDYTSGSYNLYIVDENGDWSRTATKSGNGVYTETLTAGANGGNYTQGAKFQQYSSTPGNATINYISVEEIISDPITVSFREDVKGWVSFKSFIPENALSMASDYYSIYNGRLHSHYDEYVDRNNFYGTGYNSSINVLLNDLPGTVKTFHTLNYEGSQSRVGGKKEVLVTGIEHILGSAQDGRYFFYEKQDMSGLINNQDYDSWHEAIIELKQYRGGILIYSGNIKLFNGNFNSGTASPSGGVTKGYGVYEPYNSSNPGDFQVGDIITTQAQDDYVLTFGGLNTTPTEGWYASGIVTNKQDGSLLEFVEKEGKWFNYIQGMHQQAIDTSAFDFQGLGEVEDILEFELQLRNATPGNNNGAVRVVYVGTNTVPNFPGISFAWSNGQSTAEATGLGLGPISVSVALDGLQLPMPDQVWPGVGAMGQGQGFILTNLDNGCTNPLATNFDYSANTDDGTCTI